MALGSIGDAVICLVSGQASCRTSVATHGYRRAMRAFYGAARDVAAPFAAAWRHTRDNARIFCPDFP